MPATANAVIRGLPINSSSTGHRRRPGPGWYTLPVWRTQARRVLLGVADPGARDRVAMELCRAGFSVVLCATGMDVVGEIASTILENTRMSFDLIVSDVQLPGVSGLTLLAGLRDLGVGIPVILLSELGDVQTLLAALRLKVAAVFSKPLDIARLVDAVRRAAIGIETSSA